MKRKQIQTSPEKIATLEALQQGARSAEGEKLDYTYYDTQTLATGLRDYRFFSLALGQGSPVKTKADTNMRVNAQIPQGHNHKVMVIWFKYFSDSVKDEAGLQDMNTLFERIAVTLSMPGKDDFGVWPLSEIIGNSNYTVMTPAVAGDNSPNGSSAVYSGNFTLTVPVVLPALESFELKYELFVDPPASTVGDKIKAGLRGHLIRLN